MAKIDNRGFVDDGTSSLEVLGSATFNGPVTSALSRVATLTALSSVDDSNLSDFSSCTVDSVQAVWVLDKTSTSTVDNFTVRDTRSGVGRWLRMEGATPRGRKSTAWYVSPISGSDENSGISSSAPLASLKECARRLNTTLPRETVTINVLDNITSSTDFLQIASNMSASGSLDPAPVSTTPGTGPFAPVALKIKGVRTTATFTDPNTSSTTALTMTANATAPQAIATTIAAGSDGAALPQATINVASTTGMPSAGRFVVYTTSGSSVIASVVTYTGTTATSFTGCTGGSGSMATGNKVVSELPAIITVSGFDFSSHVGKLIEILSSPVSAAVGLTCGIVKTPGTGIAYVTPINNNATHANLASVNYPTNTSTFRIYSTTTWVPHVSPGTIPGAQINFEDIEFTTGSLQNLSNGMVGFEGCVLRRPVRPSAGNENALLFNGCMISFATPAGGRSPTQLQITHGEARYLACGFVNVDLRVREGDAKVLLSSCVGAGSNINFGGPNDSGRPGSMTTFSQGFVNNTFGVGLYDWPGPDLLAPSPATTRGSTGAAVTLGHGANVVLGSRIYGDCATANTVFWRIREGSHLYVADNMTDEASPSNPASPGPAFVALSLGGCGVLGQIFLDEQPTTGSATPFVAQTHISEANLRAVLNGSLVASGSNFTTLTTFTEWRTNFSRNVVGLRTGASIVNVAS